MIVLRADESGMCFGVRDALLAIESIERPDDVTIHGELVHNPAVLRSLDERGFATVAETDRALTSRPVVLVTAHGISERERLRIAGAGKHIVDTTCPLVHKAHEAARALAAEGRLLVVLGRHDHVEVRGVVEDHDGARVVQDDGDVGDFGAERIGVMCQTTLPVDRAEHLLAAIRAANPRSDVRFVDTICAPTKARQTALLDLLARVDALVVVGGRNSNNTARLAATARAHGVPALHVEGPDDLDPTFLHGRRAVGLTAGTSTLAATVDAVERALRESAAAPLGHR